jgi:4a-hydroxytetrahydrobiopterin dehydratase
MSAQVLSPAQVDAFTREFPAWSLRNGALTREWTFPDFVEAMLFVNRVAAIAERAQHHPDIDIRYNRVLLALVSHDAGGITIRDTALARECNDLVTT